MRSSIQLPELPTGAIFNPEKGFFSVVVPLERTNIVLNPILRNNSTGWSDTLNATFSSGFLATFNYYHGYGAQVQPVVSNAPFGIFYLTSALTAGVTYAASIKFKRVRARGNATYAIAFATTGGVDLAVYTFKATGRWQWIWILWTETSSTTRRIYIRRNDAGARGNDLGAPVDEFLVSGLQVESCADGILAPTTYIDGDQLGLLTNQFPPPYRWNGTPHASTSTRLITTAAGGYLMNLDRFFYKVLAYTGLGLTAVANIASVGAGTDGATYQTSVAQARQFAINGFVDAESPQELDYRRAQLYRVLGPDGVAPRQPRTIVYEPYDGSDAIGSFGRIIASYQSGLEGISNGTPRETAPITFTQWLPAILTGEAGIGLITQNSVSDANRILKRAPDGTWAALGTGASGGAGVSAIAIGPDGTVYAGGDFTSMGGVANTSGIARWSPTTGAWSAMVSGVTGGGALVSSIAIAPNGDVYIGGNFTNVGGSGADNIARWDGSAWNVVGSATAINSTVDAMAFNAAGILYIGGGFTNAGGDANADALAQWNGTAWSAVGATAINNSVSAIAIGLDGTTLYIGGVFTNAGGVANADGIAKYDGAWAALGTPPNATDVRSLAIDHAGFLYAGGSFTIIGGVTVNFIARWNGSGWSPLSSGLDNTADAIVPFTDGTIGVGGTFTTAGGITLPDRMAIWNGTAWVAFDVDQPGTGIVDALAQSPTDGTIYVGFRTTGTATAAGINTATNPGTARAYPIFTILGPSSGTGRVFRITNTTTGRLLYLNLTINAGETVRIITSNNGTKALSNFRGNISSVILPGSSPDFLLTPGANTIAFFTTSSTVSADLRWSIALQSASDLVE